MKKLIGDKKFYLMVLAVAVPMMIQNGVTNFVSLLDNIMVGQVGTEEMSGVAIANQLMFVFNICIFGGVSGAGIFGAQFFGNQNHEGVRNAMRFKFILCGGITIFSILLFRFYGRELISLFLNEGNSVGNTIVALDSGEQYLSIMIFSLVPFMIVQVYSSTLRETGETLLPMKAGVVAVLINLILNYILIFGKFGAPKLSVSGAAIATVISRIIECLIVVLWTHKHKVRNIFIVGIYKNFKIPVKLTRQILLKGTPLILNEAFWAGGQAVLLRCYSFRGLEVIAGFNIASTLSNLFNIVFIALGSSISIIVGQLLGAGKMEEAKDTDYKLLFFSVVICIFIGSALAFVAPFFPRIYNTDEIVRNYAKHFIYVAALCMPLHAFLHATYFTIRSGGKTVITFLFDSVFVWIVNIPIAYYFTKYTNIDIILVYFLCQSPEIIKCIIGFTLVKKGIWMHNIVEE